MPLTIAHLGPAGTYAEQAAQAYADWYVRTYGSIAPVLHPCASIAQTLQFTAEGKTNMAVVPVEKLH